MKRFQKIYLEISNICNLQCRFCPGTKRPPGRMSETDFSHILPKLRPYTDYLYFHLMGEPLCHPELERFLQLAQEYGFRVILTTNGTLLDLRQELLLRSPALHKVNISLHAFEANDCGISLSAYLNRCFAFGRAAQGNVLVVYRLWNQGGADNENSKILAKLERNFPGPWSVQRRGTQIGNGVFLEYGERFDWPDLAAPDYGNDMFCYGLRDQIGILYDGTVVPCCLDHDGDISLGNLFQESMEDILSSPRANALYEGFSRRNAVEPLCRRCGFARRFK